MRTYEETHPWLTFTLDTRRFNHRLWLALGEAASKCDHIAGVPLAPRIAHQMHRLYLVKGALATTAIEGNTLSEDEAERIVSGSLKLPPSQKYLETELTNIVSAVDMLHDRLELKGPEELSIEFLKDLNRAVLADLELDDDVLPGEIRKHSVVVGRYRCAPPEDCEFLLGKFCEMLNSFECREEEKSAMCIVKAIFAHLYFVWIHPFGDGNGRTARLLEMYLLLAANFPQPTGHILSNHYNRTRQRYYERLDSAVRGEDEVLRFIQYSAEGFVDGLREQIGYIRTQQWQVAWTNYVHDLFHDLNTAADVRRRHLVLALSERVAGVKTAQLMELNATTAREYYRKTPKTLARDLNALEAMNLIERKKGMVRAKRENILAFLPWRAEEVLKDIPWAAPKA